MDKRVSDIVAMLDQCSPEQRRVVFQHLRKTCTIHPVETDLHTSAELILEAVARDRQGLTFRMLRGVIAESAFESAVIAKSSSWKATAPTGDLPYDYLVADPVGSLRLQSSFSAAQASTP